jgi:hypothetical protein
MTVEAGQQVACPSRWTQIAEHYNLLADVSAELFSR